ncbi:translation initiation factor [Thiohalobacter thiocyanaticus]|uniref:Translation initiation factor n=1 Tax=Thiohalobacter thiocyanaticus TaxID=585455 RepID=A0A1Z4VTC1_9GAMM|nr:DUF4282 domain-containing protein [Thiohalobacter thiocyanaticus]BAZ94887.1 translation initiation factor [Thiohalobacter thiocyanaticus]
MKDILFFDSMLTPKIITVVYWLLLLGVLISGLGFMFSGQTGGFLGGIAMIVGGAIGARIWCELLIVLFKIHDNIKRVAQN